MRKLTQHGRRGRPHGEGETGSVLEMVVWFWDLEANARWAIPCERVASRRPLPARATRSRIRTP